MESFKLEKLTLRNDLEQLSKLRDSRMSFLIWAKIYYKVFHTLPTKKDLMSFDFAYLTEGIHGLISYCENHLRYNSVANGKCKLREFPSSTIFIDVTHTINYPFNTGIQRVIRSLVTEMKTLQNIQLVRFEPSVNAWVLVDQGAIDNLLSFEKPDKAFGFKSNLKVGHQLANDFGDLVKAFWHGIYSAYRYLAANENGIIRRRNLDIERYKTYLNRFRRRKSLTQEFVSPDLVGQHLFIVEPIQNQDIVDSLEFFEEIGNLTCLVYDLLPISNPEFFRPTNSFTQFLRLLSFASKVSAISSFTKKQIDKYAVLREGSSLKVHLLPIGNFDSTVIPLSYPLSILNVGSFEPRKNQMSLLRACELLWARGFDFQLTLIGGQGWNNQAIKEFISELTSKGRNLSYLTDVSNQRLESEYEKASILVSIPWIEGFGLPVAEGIARKKIVIASDIPSHHEFAELQNVHFVDPGNVELLAKTLEALLNNPQRLTKVLNGEFPSWKDYAQGIYRFLQE